MKPIILIVSFIIFQFTCQAQDSLDNKVSSTLCRCLQQRQSINEKDFIGCFQTAMAENSDLIIKECKARYNDTSYEAGYKLGQALYGRISVNVYQLQSQLDE